LLCILFAAVTQVLRAAFLVNQEVSYVRDSEFT
jgi:hypothetical protein